MSTLPPKPAIFFDRDGTLIEDRGYIGSVADVVFHEDTLFALTRLGNHFLLFIVTNQGGVGAGYLSDQNVEKVNQHIVETLVRAGVTISAVYVCPHTRDQGCECIKPKPYFVLKASQEFNLDLSRSFVVGDHPHDMELSQQVGATGIYLLTGHGRKHVEEIITARQAFAARNLNEAITWILGKYGSDPQRTV